MCAAVAQVGIVAPLRIETPHSQKVKHLLIHFFFAIDKAIYHLFGVRIDGGQVEVERHFGRGWGACDVHQAVNANVVVRETLAKVEVGKAHAVGRVDGLHVEPGCIRVAIKGDGAALFEGEVFLNYVLNGELIHAVVDGEVAKHVECTFIIIGGP